MRWASGDAVATCSISIKKDQGCDSHLHQLSILSFSFYVDSNNMYLSKLFLCSFIFSGYYLLCTSVSMSVLTKVLYPVALNVKRFLLYFLIQFFKSCHVFFLVISLKWQSCSYPHCKLTSTDLKNRNSTFYQQHLKSLNGVNVFIFYKTYRLHSDEVVSLLSARSILGMLQTCDHEYE